MTTATCPTCKGDGFVGGMLCNECLGVEKIVVPQPAAKPDRKFRIISIILLSLICVGALVWGWVTSPK